MSNFKYLSNIFEDDDKKKKKPSQIAAEQNKQQFKYVSNIFEVPKDKENVQQELGVVRQREKEEREFVPEPTPEPEKNIFQKGIETVKNFLKKKEVPQGLSSDLNKALSEIEGKQQSKQKNPFLEDSGEVKTSIQSATPSQKIIKDLGEFFDKRREGKEERIENARKSIDTLNSQLRAVEIASEFQDNLEPQREVLERKKKLYEEYLENPGGDPDEFVDVNLRRKGLPEGYKEPGIIGQMTDGFLQGSVEMLSSSAAQVESMFGQAGLIYLSEQANKSKIFFDQQLAKNPEWEKPTDIGKWEDPVFYARLVSEGVPSILGSVVVGTTAAMATGGGAAIALPVGFAYSFLTEGGSAYKEAEEFGLSKEEAAFSGNTVGAINGLIESIPLFGWVGGKIGTKATKEIVEEISPSITRNIIKEVKKRGFDSVKNFLEEAGQESIQQVVSNSVAQSYDEDRSIWDGVLESFVAGGILGGLSGVVKGDVSEVIAKPSLQEQVQEDQEISKKPPGELSLGKEIEVEIEGDVNTGNEVLEDGKKIGEVSIQESTSRADQEIVALKSTQAGAGTKIVQDLLNKSDEYYVRSTPDAKGFWEKMGITDWKYNDDAGLYEGFLTKENFDNRGAKLSEGQETEVPLADIKTNLEPIVEERANTQTAKIKSIEESITRGDKIPPIPVFKSDGEYITNKDGFNRLTAYRNLGIENVPVRIEEETTLTGTAKQKVERAKAVKEGTAKQETLGEYYSKQDQEAVGQAWFEVMSELDVAEAGQRLFSEQGEFTGSLSSTFPDWVPSELRNRKLFDSVLKGLEDPNNVEFPPNSQPRKQELYEYILSEIDSRAGTDSTEIIERVRNATKEEKSKEIAPSSVERSQETKQKIEDYISKRGTVKFRQLEKTPLSQTVTTNRFVTNTKDFQDALEDVIAGRRSFSKLPALVKINSDGSISIIDGNHRIAEALLNGQENIDVITDEKAYIKLAELEDGVIPFKRGTDLKKAANKFDSLNDFVDSYGVKALHGTAATFDIFESDFKGTVTGAESARGAFWFTDDEATARAYAVYAAEEAPVQNILNEAAEVEKEAQRTGKRELWDKYDELIIKSEEMSEYDATFERRQKLANVKEVRLNGKFLELDAKGKTPQELSSDDNIDSWLDAKVKEAQKKGYAGLKINNLNDAVGLYERPSTHYAVFDPENIKTIEQLTSLFNESKDRSVRDERGRFAGSRKKVEEYVANRKQTKFRTVPYSDTFNLNDPDDAAYVSRVFSESKVEEFKNGEFSPYSKERVEEILRANIVTEEFTREPLKTQKYKGTKTFYHGTALENLSSIEESGFKKGAELSDEVRRGGGYGKMQDSVSLSSSPAIASIFTGSSDKGALIKVQVSDDAKIVASKQIEDAIDLNDHADELRNNGVDAVWIGKGEKELVVLNPDIINIVKSKEFDTYGKLKDGQLKEFYDEYGNTSRDLKEMFRVKDDVEKITGQTITDAQEQELIDLNKKIFGDDNVKITLQIMANRQALGSSKDGMITIVDGQANPKETFYHEAVHKYIDIFTTREEQVALFEAGIEKYGTDDLAQVEENIAEDFIKFAKSREGFTGFIKKIFDRIFGRINSYLSNENEIESLYNKILAPAEAKKKTLDQDPQKKFDKDGEEKEPVAKKGKGGIFNRVYDELKLETNVEDNFESITLRDQAKRATNYLEKNPEQAVLVALRQKSAPKGVTFEALNIAVSKQALANNEMQLYTDTVAARSIITARSAQGLGLERLVNSLSTDKFVQQVFRDRLLKLSTQKGFIDRFKGAFKKGGKITLGLDIITENAVAAKRKIDNKVKAKIASAQSIIDALTC